MQVIARIHTCNSTVRQLIHQLLVKIGKHHPQVLSLWVLLLCKLAFSLVIGIHQLMVETRADDY